MTVHRPLANKAGSAKRICIAFAIGLAPAAAGGADVSLTSTSQPRIAGPYTPVPQQAFAGDGAHVVLPSNDLGMHCDNLDTRIATILPPFNVLHAQVIAKGAKPALLNAQQASVIYSAAANPNDPALAYPPVFTPNGGVYKTNFGTDVLATYLAMYPPGILAPFYKLPATRKNDVGLPVPDVEQLYLGNGQLTLHQQTMPDVTDIVFDPKTNAPTLLHQKPYKANQPQPFRAYEAAWPLFVNFPFGYAADNLNWFAAEGIPITSVDDAGRVNPFPLMRVQASLAGSRKVVASTDVVVPVSAEANCRNCHLPAPYGNGLATTALKNPTLPTDDPAKAKVLELASEEWASNINTLRLHDIRYKTNIYTGYNGKTGAAKQPVLCQTCHYSPALDLAQLGPQSGNGLEQTAHETNSRVMHWVHGNMTLNGAPLFPLMPPPNDSRRTSPPGNPINKFTNDTLQASCYQCHPGERTECLRGTMFANAGVVCQDCHGQMTQVGDDFSKNLPGGTFILAADYYTNPKTPRVPWANEPTCGSCHTGDASSNLSGKSGTIPAGDTIRLLQAYLTTDAKATPILPTNLRFAEPRVTSGPAKGNPQLFRLSTDSHGGVFCEGCHGPTHAEYPVLNAASNDNVTATQLQGHTGKVLECDTCHSGSLGTTLAGPHGLHPVGKTYSPSWVSAHGDYTEGHGTSTCQACHGTHGQGTVLAIAAIDRPNLHCDGGGKLCPGGEKTITLPKDTAVSCDLCHRNPIH